VSVVCVSVVRWYSCMFLVCWCAVYVCVCVYVLLVFLFFLRSYFYVVCSYCCAYVYVVACTLREYVHMLLRLHVLFVNMYTRVCGCFFEH
jgi:hypothetical protein